MLNFVFYSSIIISRRLVPDIKDGKEIIAIALSIIKKLSGVIILKDEVNNEQLPQDGEKYDPGVCQSRNLLSTSDCHFSVQETENEGGRNVDQHPHRELYIPQICREGGG